MFPRTYKIHQEQQSPINIGPTHSTKPARIRPDYWNGLYQIGQ